MRVLITGASGYIGRELCQFLVSREHEVLAISRLGTAIQRCTNRCISDYSELSPSDFKMVDAVVHLAAKAHQANGDSEIILEGYRAVNVETTLAVARAAKAAGVARFIYMSSIKVNGEFSITPFTAYDTPAPQDAYGISKWEAEQALLDLFSDQYSKLIIIRPPLVWGGEERGNLEILRRLIQKKIPLPFKSIHNRRDLISITNLCHFVECCLTHPRALGHCFLVSDGKSLATPDIARMIASKIDIEPKLFSVPSWIWSLMTLVPPLKRFLIKVVGNLELDISKTREVTGWTPLNDFDKSL